MLCDRFRSQSTVPQPDPIHPPDRVVLKPCQDGHPDHRLVEADADTLRGLRLPVGTLLHLDMRRPPRNGELVVAELVIGQQLARTVRHFTGTGGSGGIVTLARPGPMASSLIRPRFEVGILGVVDGHLLPLARP